MKIDDAIRSFGMTNMLVHSELHNVEKKYGVDLGLESDDLDDECQLENLFDLAVQKEAKEMATHYELFYCLEKSIRSLIEDVLNPDDATDWWEDKLVPSPILERVEKRRTKEKEEGITPRSSNPIDYTTFGELSEIIRKNWVLFGAILNDAKAVEKVLTRLNTLRGPIAHCSPLAEDEVLRLTLTVRDWFRLLV